LGFSELHQLLSYTTPLNPRIYGDYIQAETVNTLAKYEDAYELIVNARQVDRMVGDDIVVVAQHRLRRLAHSLDVGREGACDAGGDILCISMNCCSNA